MCRRLLFQKIRERTILINGMSKSYAMTGWRIGYTAASKEVICAMNVLQSQMLSSVHSLSQKAAVAALTGTQEPMQSMIREFEKRRDYMRERLNRMRGISCRESMGAFYLLPDIRGCYGKSYRFLHPVICVFLTVIPWDRWKKVWTGWNGPYRSCSDSAV